MAGWIIFALAAAGVWWYEHRNTDSSIGGHPVQVVGNPPAGTSINIGSPGNANQSVIGGPLTGPNAGLGPPPPAPGLYMMGDDSKIPKKGNIGGGGPGNAGAIARNRIQQLMPQTQPSWWHESLQEDIRYKATPNVAGIKANDFRNLGDNHGGRA